MEAHLVECGERYGYDNWKAVDMAAHGCKWVEFQKEQEHKARERDGTEAQARERKQREFREEQRRRHREKIDFRNAWLDQGYENWRKNQLVKKKRRIRDLQYELSLLMSAKNRKEKKRLELQEDVMDGTAWFDTNLERLGLDGEMTTMQKDVMLKEATKMLDDPAEAQEFVVELKKRAETTAKAKTERERRRRKMMFDQQKEQQQLDLRKKSDAVATLCSKLEKLQNCAIPYFKWKATAEFLTEEQRQDKVAKDYQEKFDADFAVAFDKFTEEARARAESKEALEEQKQIASRIQEIKKISKERKAMKALAVCRETVDKVIDLTCSVLSLKEQTEDKMIDLDDWRKLKTRFVSRDAFFTKRYVTPIIKGADPDADLRAAKEITDFSDDLDPTTAAFTTMRGLVDAVDGIALPAAPSTVEDAARVRLCALGNLNADMVPHGVHVVTAEDAAGLAVATALHGDDAHDKLVDVGSRLLGVIQEAAALQEADAPPPEVVVVVYSDLLLAEAIGAYVGTLERSWVLVGFPKTLLQTKLLEHVLGGYVDDEVKTVIAEAESKKKKDKSRRGSRGSNMATPRGDEPNDPVSAFDAVIFSGSSGDDDDVEAWWRALPKASVVRLGGTLADDDHETATSARVQEQLDVAIEACQLRQERSQQEEKVKEAEEGEQQTTTPEEEKQQEPTTPREEEPSSSEEEPAAEVPPPPPPTLEEDMAAVLTSRVAQLGPLERTWRGHQVGERRLDVVGLRAAVEAWQKEGQFYAEALDGFVYTIDEHTQAMAQLRARALETKAQSSEDPRWEAPYRNAMAELGEAKRKRRIIVDEMELAMGDAVDDRRLEAKAIAQRHVIDLRRAMAAASDHLNVSVVLLVGAEQDRFRAARNLLTDYHTHVDDVTSSDDDGPGDASFELDFDDIPADVGAKFRAAAVDIEGDPQYLGRLHRILARYKTARSDWETTTSDLDKALSVRPN